MKKIIDAINSGYEVTVQFYNYESDEYYDVRRVYEAAYFNVKNALDNTQYDVDYYYSNKSLRFIIIL